MADTADALGVKLTAVEKRRHADSDFAGLLARDPASALAELNFTAAEAGRFRLAVPHAWGDDSCTCVGTVGRGCLVKDQPGTFG